MIGTQLLEFGVVIDQEEQAPFRLLLYEIPSGKSSSTLPLCISFNKSDVSSSVSPFIHYNAFVALFSTIASLRIADLWQRVDRRLRTLMAAEKMVVEDPEILGGTPVVRGTRVPVHMVAAQFDAGTPIERILKSYPSLTEAQVGVASVYAKAVPQRGRPKRREFPAGTKVLNVKRGSLKSGIAG